MNHTETCSHKYCHCPAQAGSGYCCDYCANASHDQHSEGICQCGHLDCSGAMLVVAEPVAA